MPYSRQTARLMMQRGGFEGRGLRFNGLTGRFEGLVPSFEGRRESFEGSQIYETSALRWR
jgi:hypothetical protein